MSEPIIPKCPNGCEAGFACLRCDALSGYGNEFELSKMRSELERLREQEAGAAAMRGAVQEAWDSCGYCDGSHQDNDGENFINAACRKCDPFGAALSSNAGRELLAEVERLREQNRVLEVSLRDLMAARPVAIQELTSLRRKVTAAEGMAAVVKHTASQLNCHCFSGVNLSKHEPCCNIGNAIAALTAWQEANK